jgi:hypothetical protein
VAEQEPLDQQRDEDVAVKSIGRDAPDRTRERDRRDDGKRRRDARLAQPGECGLEAAPARGKDGRQHRRQSQ